MSGLVEEENAYYNYYRLSTARGLSYMVRALNGQQAIAHVLHHEHRKTMPMFCVDFTPTISQIPREHV